MIHELVHALIQRIMHDKIILGLVAIGILALFMGNLNSKDEPASATKGHHEGSEQQQQAQAGSQSQSPAQTSSVAVEPSLAQDFVKWWLGMAMDYSAQTASQNHQQAFAWMTQDAMVAFQQIYWSHEMADGVADGRIVAAFQPTAIQAKAVNPDGSVVVGVQGTYVLQTGAQPVPYQVKADLLIKRSQVGLRVAGVYNELAATPGASVY
jgi:hypothetical protein